MLYRPRNPRFSSESASRLLISPLLPFSRPLLNPEPRTLNPPHRGATTIIPLNYPATMTDKIVYLMRGLPSCGKSTTAKKLAGDTGVICETDEYFYTQVG